MPKGDAAHAAQVLCQSSGGLRPRLDSSRRVAAGFVARSAAFPFTDIFPRRVSFHGVVPPRISFTGICRPSTSFHWYLPSRISFHGHLPPQHFLSLASFLPAFRFTASVLHELPSRHLSSTHFVSRRVSFVDCMTSLEQQQQVSVIAPAPGRDRRHPSPFRVSCLARGRRRWRRSTCRRPEPS